MPPIVHRLLASLVACPFALAWAAVDVNTASPEDLMAIKGIGPSTQQKLVAARPFQDWDDLLARVSGIGPSRAEKLSAQGLTVNGQRYVRAPQQWRRFEPRPVLP